MTTLAELQKSLHDFLQGKPSDIEQHVSGKNITEVKRRLKIYQDAYQMRLLENLRKQFPVLARYLGEEKFVAFATGYEAAFPPQGFAIRRYGEHVAEFLLKTSTGSAESAGYLSELAAFEWAMNEALDESADAPLFTQAHLQQFTPDALLAQRFRFHPSLRGLLFHYDIPNFWQA